MTLCFPDRETSRVNGHVNGNRSRSPPVSHSGDSIGSSESLLDRASPAASVTDHNHNHTMNGQGVMLEASADRANKASISNGMSAWSSLDSSINSGSSNNNNNNTISSLPTTTNNNDTNFADENNSLNKSYTSSFKFQPSPAGSERGRSASNGSITALVASPPSSSPLPPPPPPSLPLASQSGISYHNSSLTLGKGSVCSILCVIPLALTLFKKPLAST
ncbi:hypothetical protein ElyMa_004514400 [Elysia marginata]|uniref:Uncharacterized protein n=1 Tax=Elysia marginata TaxID=1093978 RepID=A0AAV4HLY9_9GAST|nr:hypothetical protein ElyMa_004514400 [Elysia marginata]